jgi:hypothetical protein
VLRDRLLELDRRVYESRISHLDEDAPDLAARFAALSQLRTYPSSKRVKPPATILTYIENFETLFLTQVKEKVHTCEHGAL